MTARRISSSDQSSINGDGFRSLNEGDKVSYESEDSDKGPRAANVDKI